MCPYGSSRDAWSRSSIEGRSVGDVPRCVNAISGPERWRLGSAFGGNTLSARPRRPSAVSRS